MRPRLPITEAFARDLAIDRQSRSGSLNRFLWAFLIGILITAWIVSWAEYLP